MKCTISLLFLLLLFQESYSQKTHTVLVSISQPAACLPTSFGVDDIEVIAYPNPTTDELRIQSELMVEKVLIIDPTGRIIYQNENLGTDFNINMRPYSKGIYQSIIITNKGVKKSKIILQ